VLAITVLFVAENPLGYAAVIAYAGCIGLSLIQLVAAYFVPVFIIYHRKLNQIEENTKAINRLLERQSELQTIDGQSLEDRIVQISTKLAKDLQDEDGDAETLEFVIEEHADLDEDHLEIAQKNEGEASDEDENQIFLSFESHSDASEDALVEDSEEVPEFNLPTHIQVYSFIGNNNTLYIRGDAPLSWDQGTEMEMLDVGKFEIIVDVKSEQFNFDLYINDQVRAVQSPLRVAAGDTIECYPEFKKAKRGRSSG